MLVNLLLVPAVQRILRQPNMGWDMHYKYHHSPLPLVLVLAPQSLPASTPSDSLRAADS